MQMKDHTPQSNKAEAVTSSPQRAADTQFLIPLHTCRPLPLQRGFSLKETQSVANISFIIRNAKKMCPIPLYDLCL